jgi:endonuclease/exonuclease/phosphatase family metal-dependent hydrolase
MTPRIGTLVGAALLSSGCARATNLLSADAPRFVGAYAPLPTVGSASPAAPLRIVTFNIKEAREIDRAIAVLRRDSVRGADIVALQEMDEIGVDRIASALRLNYVYYPAVVHHHTGGYYGPAVLSRWPIERSWKLILPHGSWDRGQRRTATAAVVRANGIQVLVYAVHLETVVKLSDARRAEQALAVAEDARRWTGPVVIAGDFNDPGPAARLRREGYTWVTEWVGPTHTMFSLDHILTRGLVPARPRSVGVVQRVGGASDHHPVWAVLVPAHPGASGFAGAAGLSECHAEPALKEGGDHVVERARGSVDRRRGNHDASHACPRPRGSRHAASIRLRRSAA